jgi:hypothetical protein
MAGRSGKRRGPGRQVLGVASLTAVASGTTALVIVMGSAHVSQQLLTAPYADGNAGGPLVVDQPRTHVAVPADTAAPRSGQTGGPRAVNVIRPPVPAAAPVAPVVRPVAPAPEVRPPDVPALPIVLPGLPVVPGVPPVVGPGRPVPGQPGTPSVEDPGASDNPDIDEPDTPDAPDSPDPDEPDTDEPDLPGTPADPTPGDGTLCGIDGAGMHLPQDVIDRLEQWLCGATGRTVTIVAKPLRLVSPVPVKVEARATVPAVYTPRHGRTTAAKPAVAPAKKTKSMVRAVAARPGMESRGMPRTHEGKNKHDRQRPRDRAHHKDRGDRHDVRGLGQAQTDVWAAVVRSADAGVSWLHYTGRHRVGR